MYSWEGLLDLENEKYVVSIFSLGRAHFLLLFILCVSVHRGQTPAVQPGAHLSPASGRGSPMFLIVPNWSRATVMPS